AGFIVEVEAEGEAFETRAFGHTFLIKIVARQIVSRIFTSSAQTKLMLVHGRIVEELFLPVGSPPQYAGIKKLERSISSCDAVIFANHLRILPEVHHLERSGRTLQAVLIAISDLDITGLTSFGGYQKHPVGSTRPINGRSRR